MWWQQYRKELLGHRGESALIAGAIVVWIIFLLSRIGIWRPDVITGVYWLPMGFLPLWVLWTSVQLYRQEWRENTSYLMLSLPVRARVITSAKLAVLVTGIVGFTLLILAGGWIVAARTGFLGSIVRHPEFAKVPTEWIIKMSLFGYGGLVVGLVVLGLISQFAYLFSRLFTRFQGLVMVWTWILMIWLLGVAADLGSVIFGWLPDFYLRSLTIFFDTPEFSLVRVESGPIVAVALLLIGIYSLLNVLLEQVVEV